MKRTLALAGALIALLVLAIGCGGTAPTPVSKGAGKTVIQRTPTPVPATDEEAIRQIINAECEAVVQQDIDRLQGIWASDGVVTDANHTADNTGDDVTWKGWDAIRDRYVNIVFPSSPTFCEHPGTLVTVSGTTATGSSGVKIGQTNCTDCNKWVFAKGAEGWKISTLTYNLNPQK
ncbi:MAG: nuclear transport factor 2 family protein [Rudaea sp.]